MDWLAAHIHECIIAAVGGVIVAWLTGFLNQFLPSPSRVRLALTNVLWRRPARSGDGFRLVLCWLKNDHSGEDTETVEEAFRGISGLTLVRSARMVTASGAGDDWKPDVQASARAILQAWDADLAITGRVKRPREVLSLWFVPRLGDGTLDRGDRPYKLEDVTLGSDFHNDLRAQLTATALASIAPLALPVPHISSLDFKRGV